MKTPRFERFRRSARQYRQRMHSHQFQQGIRVRHDYGDIDQNGLSWWDDTQIILGRMRVTICWQHPRTVYKDLIDEAALAATEHVAARINGDIFDNDEKVFKRVGRSRKKVDAYRWNPPQGHAEWIAAVTAEKARLSREADYRVETAFKVEQLSWCRSVSIVAPIEVRNEQELRDLAHLVRRVLKGETTLEREFPGYVYDRAQWLAEGLHEDPSRLLSHRIAGL